MVVRLANQRTSLQPQQLCRAPRFTQTLHLHSRAHLCQRHFLPPRHAEFVPLTLSPCPVHLSASLHPTRRDRFGWATHGCASTTSKMATSAGGTRVTMALSIASCTAQTAKCTRAEAVCAAAAHFVRRTCFTIQSIMSNLLDDAVYLDIWATRTGDRSLSGCASFSPYCFPVACSPVGCAAWSVVWALGTLACAVNIEIKSYFQERAQDY